MVRERDSDSDDCDTSSVRTNSGPPSGISEAKRPIGRGRGRGRLKSQISSNPNLSGFSSGTKKSSCSFASSNGSGSQPQSGSQSQSNDLSSIINSHDSESKSAFSDLKSEKSSISNNLSIGMSRLTMNSIISTNSGPKIRKVFIIKPTPKCL